MNLDFFEGKRVFVTGHTGFKGNWLCKVLVNAGALVTGYALAPPDMPNLFALSGLEQNMRSIIGDIRDIQSLKAAFDAAKAEIVLHLAAQPLVLESYTNPVYTYETNIMGTVNVLECIRLGSHVRSFVNITTDKVYKNNEWEWGYREIDPLDGFDPYSNSKSCSELVTHSYKNSFFSNGRAAISTARAGNVIGGGDFALNRIIPDCIRAATKGDVIKVRNPNSIRPYQHVLEPVYAYLMIAARQYENNSLSGWYNIGPDDCDCVTTAYLVNIFCEKWGVGQDWEYITAYNPHEANFLKLDCARLKKTFGWKPRWDVATAVEKTVVWTKAYINGENMSRVMDEDIKAFLKSGAAPDLQAVKK